MIKLNRSIIRAIEVAQVPSDLYPWLQNAIELEHSTIPPYLTAMFSLKPGKNDEIARLIHSIVVEEMLHMTIASNVLIAIKGTPAINKADFIPKYPGPLPMSVGGKDFIVGIEAFSIPLVENIFMKIEEPEKPIPVQKTLAAVVPDFATIGEFYDALKKKLAEFGNSIFVAPPSQQVSQWFDDKRLFPIVDVASADRGIDIIVQEGEGTSTDPFQSPGDPAHYYKFGEIAAGKKIVPKPGGGYVYGGVAIPFDAAAVYPMKPNPKLANFAPDTQARERAEAFDLAYSSLLNALHTAFNGQPDRINVAIGLMYELKMIAVSLMQTPIGDGSSQTAGPTFEYIEAPQAAFA
jgi:Ferritin-like